MSLSCLVCSLCQSKEASSSSSRFSFFFCQESLKGVPVVDHDNFFSMEQLRTPAACRGCLHSWKNPSWSTYWFNCDKFMNCLLDMDRWWTFFAQYHLTFINFWDVINHTFDPLFDEGYFWKLLKLLNSVVGQIWLALHSSGCFSVINIHPYHFFCTDNQSCAPLLSKGHLSIKIEVWYRQRMCGNSRIPHTDKWMFKELHNKRLKSKVTQSNGKAICSIVWLIKKVKLAAIDRKGLSNFKDTFQRRIQRVFCH